MISSFFTFCYGSKKKKNLNPKRQSTRSDIEENMWTHIYGSQLIKVFIKKKKSK